MTEYHVTWTIDVDADTAEDAARHAREIQLRPDSSATVFRVTQFGSRISDVLDLDEIDGKS